MILYLVITWLMGFGFNSPFWGMGTSGKFWFVVAVIWAPILVPIQLGNCIRKFIFND